MPADKAQQVAVNADVRDFHASDKWASGFKRRHHFSLRSPTRQSQVCPADIDRIAAAFAAVVKATIRDLGVRCVYNADQTGWWNGGLSVEFLWYHFAARPSPQEPILLLWGDFSGHWTAEVQRYATSIGVVLLQVPPGATSVSLPADVAWNYPLKSRLRQQWHDDMREQIAAPRSPGSRFKLARPKRDKICKWIDCAWRAFLAATIANGFRACGLQPTQSCAAASDLVAQLEELSPLQGRPVDDEQDFAVKADE
ncbi:hypothetical protein V7S43_012320 [Phytophthora oleae]|uniref:HTH CENPB-type domain-containing protein n=1 Tax=Phytophthora oleae TaxID=2107226 RepID=A0ABD3F8Z1_9STRA